MPIPGSHLLSIREGCKVLLKLFNRNLRQQIIEDAANACLLHLLHQLINSGGIRLHIVQERLVIAIFRDIRLKESSHFSVCHLGVHRLQLGTQFLLRKPPLGPPVEISTSILPFDHVTDHALGLHSPRSVVQVRKLVCNLQIQRHEHHLPVTDFLLDDLDFIRICCGCQLFIQCLQRLVHLVHFCNLIGLPEFDGSDTCRFQNTTATFNVSVHLHYL
mmetsp:Transcript_80901/g.135348  ORF Transcript_80901/g.135348 Transcript_80901/m.135348 type:complete len:217 (+) Transcript_80901:353-1003(+)